MRQDLHQGSVVTAWAVGWRVVGSGLRAAATATGVVGLALIAALAAPASAPANWNQSVAAPLNVDPTQNAFVSGFAVVGGAPYVSWYESNGTNDEIRVKQLVGGAWASVGGSLNFNTADDGRGPTLASIGGAPYVSWYESNGTNDEIRVAMFNGSAWTAVGASPNADPTKDGSFPSITSVGGVPYVAWMESNGTVTQIRVKRYNGSTWVEPAAGPLNVDATKNALYPRITSIGGVPYVTWEESNGVVNQIRVKLFNGSAWVEPKAGPLNLEATQNAGEPAIASIGGVPYVAWDEANPNQIRVKRFDGSNWVSVGGSLNVNPGKDAFAPSIISIGGVPYVAWNDGDVRLNFVKRFDGSNWVLVGGALNVDQTKDAEIPFMISIGGVPYVAWDENTATARQARVKRLEPDFLSEAATPSPTGATLSAQINDFGVPLPIGFELGTTPSFGVQTPLETSPGVGISTLTQTVSGLMPSTLYDWRAFGSDTFRETSVGATQTFATPATPALMSALTPVVTSATQSHHRWREGNRSVQISRRKEKPPLGTVFSFSLNEEASVSFAFTQHRDGRKVKGKCAAQTKNNRRKPACERTVTRGTLYFTGHIGTNKVAFQGRISRAQKLKPGRYTLVITAMNAAGQKSPPQKLSFTIVR